MSVTNKHRAVIFDFDGTVVDTMPFLVELAVRVLGSWHRMAPDRARRAYVATTGLPFARQLEIISPGDPANPAASAEFEAEKDNHIMDFELFPDAREVTARIRGAGIKVCVSSGNRQDLITALLDLKGLQFDLVMGYRPGFEKGLAHFECARATFDTTFENLTFLGDSLKDALAAKNGGVRFIAKEGLFARSQFEEVLPGTPVIGSLTEILPLLGIADTPLPG